MSTLRVDNLQGQTPDGISKYVVQYHYNTPASGSNLTDFGGQTGITINNTTTRGTSSISFSRKLANSSFVVNVSSTWYRPSTTGLLKGGYRLNSGTDIVTYWGDNNGTWVRSACEFLDTTSGSVGDTVLFETVFTNTASNDSAVRHIAMSVMEIAQ